MDLAEDFLKYLLLYALDHCKDDLEFLSGMYDNELVGRLNFVITNQFERITYTHAIEILQQSGEKFEYPVTWGVDLQTEHERFLVERYYKRPVIVTDYPLEIKAFYMKQNDDGKTVRGMDVLFPKIGEIIGGSQREENYEKLIRRIRDLKLPEEDLWWYIETRKFGSAPHSGFGLGFERLILFVTGMSNIRDVIPFPRFPKNADF
jgi:asparaginyl-tRNA synthetase